MTRVSCVTDHGADAEDVTVVTPAAVVLGDIGEVREVIGILTSAVDVSDLVFADQLLDKEGPPFIPDHTLIFHHIRSDLTKERSSPASAC